MKLNNKAFTLVELIASMAILVVLVVAIAQVLSSATKIYEEGKKSIDADSEGRAVMEYVSRDLSQAVFGMKTNDFTSLLVNKVTPDKTNPSRRTDELFFMGLRDEAEYTNSTYRRALRVTYYYVDDDSTLMRVSRPQGTQVEDLFGVSDSNTWRKTVGRSGRQEVVGNVWSFRVDVCTNAVKSLYSKGNTYSSADNNLYYVNLYLELIDEDTLRRIEVIENNLALNDPDLIAKIAKQNVTRFSKRVFFNNQHGQYNVFR